MRIIEAEQVHATLSYPGLVDALAQAFAKPFTMPPRNVYPLDESSGAHDAFALLPAWTEDLIAAKAFTYFPHNPRDRFRSIYAKILLFGRQHGEPLALVDGTSVTLWRTAGVSALASRLLSREDSSTLLLLGTGNLAPFIIRAQCSVRPLRRVLVWGRAPDRAADVVAAVGEQLPEVEATAVEDLRAACAEADIIVSATGSHDPLVHGDWVRPGTHTDFIGNHLADRRECDTELVLRSSVYLDSRENCLREAGEILVPITEGVFDRDQVIGDLAEMCTGRVPLRRDREQITLFKSVGTALSDLAAAGAAFRVIAASG